MKRAFIRLFGCILSAIGLSMSYDATFTVVLDDESAPGMAWAVSGSTGADVAVGDSGSGGGGTSGLMAFSSECSNGYAASGCTVVIPGAGAGWDVSGTCDYEGHRMQYATKFITGWYVAWPNYKGGGVATTYGSAPAGWPYPLLHPTVDNKFYINFSLTLDSGSGDAVGMSGTYKEVFSDIDGNSFDMCTGRNVPCYYPDYSGACTAGRGLYNGTCITNVDDGYGGLPSSIQESMRMYGPIYRYGADAFVKFGCGLASSNGTCASSYKCCYGPTTNVYTVTGCGLYKNYNQDNWSCGSITTQRVVQPIVFYQFSGCSEQFYPNEAVAGANGNFSMDGFGSGGPYNGKYDGYESYDFSACPGTDSDSHLKDQPISSDSSKRYTFVFDTCKACSDMTAISNSSSFSPTITTMGTVTYLPSNTVNTCRASVKGNKDSSGTFDIVGNCTY